MCPSPQTSFFFSIDFQYFCVDLFFLFFFVFDGISFIRALEGFVFAGFLFCATKKGEKVVQDPSILVWDPADCCGAGRAPKRREGEGEGG